MLNRRFWSFIAGLSVLFLTTTAYRPTASNPTAPNEPATVGAVSPMPEPTAAVNLSNTGKPKAVSGAYGQCFQALAKMARSRVITAIRPELGQYNCDFYIRGKMRKGVAEIKTWFPKDKQIICGQLKFVEAGGKLGISQARLRTGRLRDR